MHLIYFRWLFLLSANEVWCKVMFLQGCVILSMGGGGVMISLPAWLPGSMFLPERGSLSRGCLCLGGLCRETPGIRKAGGTLPTGFSGFADLFV